LLTFSALFVRTQFKELYHTFSDRFSFMATVWNLQ